MSFVHIKTYANAMLLARGDNQKFALIDSNNIPLTSFVYDSISDFYDDIAIVIKDDLYGVINTRGAQIIPCKYNYISIPVEEMLLAKINNRYGYFDCNGVSITSFIYENATNFSNGRALVVRNGQVMTINKYGVVISHPWEGA